MLAAITARKSLEDIAASSEGHGGKSLTKSLGPVSLVGLGIGCIIGAGIFVLTGEAAAKYAGPAITLSFVLSGVACAFVGLCYSELAAMIPASGSAYTYAYATVGELFAWIIGWDLILEYAMGAATVAVGWSGYLTSLLKSFGINLPVALTMAPGQAPADTGSWSGLLVDQFKGICSALPEQTVKAIETTDQLTAAAGGTGIFNLPAALIVGALSLLLMTGAKESTRVNNVMVIFKLFVVLTVIVVGAAYVTTANWTPFLPPNRCEFGSFGWSGILRGASVVFFAYIGFDAVSTAAQEAKNPQRDMPLAILGSLTICTILYVLMAGVMTGMVHYDKLNVADPVSVAIDVTKIGWLSVLVKFAALVGLTTVIFVLLFGQSRVLYSISRDGLLPKFFGTVHERFGTPFYSQASIGVVVAIIAGLVPISVLGEMVSIGTLFAFLLVCVAVIQLRRSRPRVRRPFRVPAVPWVPCLGIAFSALLMLGLPLATWLRLLIWLVVGLAIYFGYGLRHSAQRKKG